MNKSLELTIVVNTDAGWRTDSIFIRPFVPCICRLYRNEFDTLQVLPIAAANNAQYRETRRMSLPKERIAYRLYDDSKEAQRDFELMHEAFLFGEIARLESELDIARKMSRAWILNTLQTKPYIHRDLAAFMR